MTISLTGEAVAAAIKATEYKYFGDYEMSDDQREAVDVLVDVARRYFAATTARPTERGAVEDSGAARLLISQMLHGEANAIARAKVDDDDRVFIAMDDVEALIEGLLLPATDQAAEEREGCVGTMDAARAIYFLERFKREEKWLGPHEQWALDFTITALDTQTATGRTMGGEDKQAVADLHALQHDGTTLAAKPTWGGSIIRWAVDEIKGLRAALQNGGER